MLNSLGVENSACSQNKTHTGVLDGTSYEGEIIRLTEKVVVSSSENLNVGDDSVRRSMERVRSGDGGTQVESPPGKCAQQS